MNTFLGIPTPSPLQPRSRVHDLKIRLDWGDPALTIIDVRDRTEFNREHIRGAISLPDSPTGSLMVKRARETLELNRDIYVYSYTDTETAVAAKTLRDAGFTKVSELRGGLAAWKAVGYPTELLFLEGV